MACTVYDPWNYYFEQNDVLYCIKSINGSDNKIHYNY